MLTAVSVLLHLWTEAAKQTMSSCLDWENLKSELITNICQMNSKRKCVQYFNLKCKNSLNGMLNLLFSLHHQKPLFIFNSHKKSARFHFPPETGDGIPHCTLVCFNCPSYFFTTSFLSAAAAPVFPPLSADSPLNILQDCETTCSDLLWKPQLFLLLLTATRI